MSSREQHDTGFEEALTYCDFPSEHWIKIRTNNVIERMNREIWRRTRVLGAFPDGNSAALLVTLTTGYFLQPDICPFQYAVKIGGLDI